MTMTMNDKGDRSNCKNVHCFVFVVLHCLKEEVCSNPAAVAYQEEETPYFFFLEGRGRKGEKGKGGKGEEEGEEEEGGLEAKPLCGS